MRLVTIGLGNVDPTVGAFTANTDKVIAVAREMAARGVTVGCFPEQVISGYPAEDLVQWNDFVAAQWRQLTRFAAATATLGDEDPVFVLGLTVADGGHLYNAAAVVAGGIVRGVVPKEKLPTYGVFYEQRTFSPGSAGRAGTVHGVPFGDLMFRFPFGVLAVEVCEDMWSPDGPMRRRAYSGAELVVNVSASPWRAGVVTTRREMIGTRAADNVATVVYVNQVGGNDSLVFDGGGFVNQAGRMIGEAPRWREGLTTIALDLDRTTRLRRENGTWRADCEMFLRSQEPVATIAVEAGRLPDASGASYPVPASKNLLLPDDHPGKSPREEYFDDLLDAMVTGLRGYFEKTGVFERIGIALSGGRDSALALIVACLYAERRFEALAGTPAYEAARRDFIHGFSMPTRFNTAETRGIARELAQDLGVTFVEVPIAAQVEAAVALLRRMHGEDREIPPGTLQNVQARVRGTAMWNWSNAARGFWIQTGNMSEKAVGYTTIGGDLMGAYALIGNLPKTVVSALLEHLARTRVRSAALDRLLTTRASAELAEDQDDEADLMPFPVLDACYALFAGEKLTAPDVYRVVRAMWTDEELKGMRADYTPGMLKAWVARFVRLFRASIFKWVQAPQSVHLGALDLDRERALQLPVVQSAEWLQLPALDALPD